MRPRLPFFGFVVAVLGALAACRCTPKPPPDGAPTATTPKASTSTAPGASAPPPSTTEPSTVSASNDADAKTSCPAALAETRRDGTKPNSYVEPTEEERKAARAAIAAVLEGKSAEVAAFGFEEVPLEGWANTVLLREKEGRRRGGGAYVVRRGSTSKLVVQAPHTFYDEGTLPLACDFFQRSSARVLAINTVHRYKAAPPVGDKHPSDVAHSPASLFQAVTEGIVAALPGLTVLQLHGFANREVTARAVVSVGEKKKGAPLVAKVATALEGAVGPRILKYPEDTNELGATTNVQGQVVRRAGGHFVHIEMDDGLRRELQANDALRAKAFAAVIGALAP